MNSEDEAYLEVPEEHVKKIAAPNTVWAKIGDDGKLEAGKEAAQTHVMCKLLVLVRDQVRKERHASGN